MGQDGTCLQSCRKLRVKDRVCVRKQPNQHVSECRGCVQMARAC